MLSPSCSQLSGCDSDVLGNMACATALGSRSRHDAASHGLLGLYTSSTQNANLCCCTFALCSQLHTSTRSAMCASVLVDGQPPAQTKRAAECSILYTMWESTGTCRRSLEGGARVRQGARVARRANEYRV